MKVEVAVGQDLCQGTDEKNIHLIDTVKVAVRKGLDLEAREKAIQPKGTAKAVVSQGHPREALEKLENPIHPPMERREVVVETGINIRGNIIQMNLINTM